MTVNAAAAMKNATLYLTDAGDFAARPKLSSPKAPKRHFDLADRRIRIVGTTVCLPSHPMGTVEGT